jgi:hypothetical protein
MSVQKVETRASEPQRNRQPNAIPGNVSAENVRPTRCTELVDLCHFCGTPTALKEKQRA